MAKRNSDLFERLRRLGVRKQVAKTLSELSDDAGKKAVRARQNAVAELRALAEEIEKRLPGTSSAAKTDDQPTPATTTRRRATPSAARPATRTSAPKAAASRPRASAASRARTTAASRSRTPAASRPRATAARPAAPAAKRRPASSTSSRAPRGENKAKILAALKTGPRTASEIGQATGIGTGTVSTTLTKMAKAGEVTKAARGYALPK